VAVGLWPFRQFAQEWAAGCVCHGVGSGEGLIERVSATVVGDGLPATDTRCLLRLSELSALFTKARRDGSSLPEVVREAWDGEPLSLPNRGAAALTADGYLVSVVGDITPAVLTKVLDRGTEGTDGTSSRFLWCAVASSQELPSGGSMEPLRPFLGRLQEVIAFARSAGEMSRDAEAEALWVERYRELKRCPERVPHTERARPYVMRLAALYALADGTNTIGHSHLSAGLAVWNYCQQSAEYLFGLAGSEMPAGLDGSIFELVTRAGAAGISRNAIVRANRRANKDEVSAALDSLAKRKLIHSLPDARPGAGRKAERWHAGPVSGVTVMQVGTGLSAA
jgi:hypothetical protein